MKKFSFLLIAMLVTVLLHAQLPFTFGPKIGYSTSKLSTNRQDIHESFRSDMHAGVFVRLGKKTYLQPEVNFTTKGGLFGSNDHFNAREVRLSTVEIPLLIGSKIIDCKVFNLRLMAGPSMSFIVDKEINMRQGFDNIDTGLLEDAIWGIQAGIGADVLMFTLDVRYEWGLNNLSDINGIEMRNNMFIVSLGWKIL